MRPTVEFLEERFARFNQLCFGGELPQVRLRVSSARTYLGQLRYQRKRRLFGATRITDLEIAVSQRYDMPQCEVEDTLLHEMIHLYILVKNLRDESTHGPVFRKLMTAINQRFGRNITVSHRRTEDEMNQDTQRRNHYVCVSHLRDGRVGITLATPSSIFQLWRGIAAFDAVRSSQWYVSADPWFNRFRRSRTVKIYAVDVAALNQHLQTARQLEMEAGRIVVKKTQ